MRAQMMNGRSVCPFVVSITRTISITLFLGAIPLPAQNSGAEFRAVDQAAAPLTREEGVPRFGHVFVIIGENTIPTII